MNDSTVVYVAVATPLGTLRLAMQGPAIRALEFDAPIVPTPPLAPSTQRLADDVRRQLDTYFEGRPVTFDFPLAPSGTPFQRSVWDALCGIPYGETASYGEIARRIGRPSAVRAVGAANGRNPIAILVPCHRVIGANGTLTGYAGGLERKQALLALEAPALFARFAA